MISPKSLLTRRPDPSQVSPAAQVPDGQRLQAQLAEIAEGEPAGGETSLARLLQHLRALMAARSVALLPMPGAAEAEITFAGAELPELAQRAESLDRNAAQVHTAPVLGPHGYTLSVPVAREGKSIGWLIAHLEIRHQRDVQAFVVLLQAFAGYLLYREQRQEAGPLHRALESSSSLLDIFRHAGGEPDFQRACRIALDELCAHLGCSRISFGVRRRGGLRIVAISGTARVDAKSPNLQPIEAAMSEAMRANSSADWKSGNPRADTTVAREILAERDKVARILALPLPNQRGGLLCEWSALPAADAEPAIDAAAPFVPVLFDLLERNRPNPTVYAIHRVWRRASANRRRLVLLGLGALGLLLAWPFHYRVGADCRIAPTIKQVVAAPFDGQLRKSFVRPGDAVREGDPLGELDNRELKLKEAELVAGRDRALKQRDRAMAGGLTSEGADYAASQLANLEAQSIAQELELVRKKLELLSVKAPLSGVVVSGDLRRAEGQPVPRGQVLWEVAPLDAMIVEMDVPDREISRIQGGQPVRVRLEAFGGGQWETVVRRIHPESEQREGKNSFIVEADISAAQLAGLRPGMRGRAIIETEKRPLIWIIGHRFWEWVETNLYW